MKQELKSFEKFMLSQDKWTLANKTSEMLTYEHEQEAKKGSCLVALVLFLFFIIPAILYLYFSSKPAKTMKFSISVDDEGGLWVSGSPEGKRLLQAFRKHNNPSVGKKSSTGLQRIDITPFYKKWWGILLLIVFWPFAIQAVALHYTWRETDWDNRVKWSVTAGVVVVTLIILLAYSFSTDPI